MISLIPSKERARKSLDRRKWKNRAKLAFVAACAVAYYYSLGCATMKGLRDEIQHQVAPERGLAAMVGQVAGQVLTGIAEYGKQRAQALLGTETLLIEVEPPAQQQ